MAQIINGISEINDVGRPSTSTTSSDSFLFGPPPRLPRRITPCSSDVDSILDDGSEGQPASSNFDCRPGVRCPTLRTSLCYGPPFDRTSYAPCPCSRPPRAHLGDWEHPRHLLVWRIMPPIFVPHFPHLAGQPNARLTLFGIEGQFHYVS
jgi:hypothetical protein